MHIHTYTRQSNKYTYFHTEFRHVYECETDYLAKILMIISDGVMHGEIIEIVAA